MPGRLLKLEEGNVHVVEYGTRADAAGTVILIHGLFGSSQFWGCTVDCCNGLGPFLVERGFHVVSYDLWGHGFSDAPDPGDHAYSPEFFSEQLLHLLDALAVQAAHVVGHSLGAVIATTAALTSPDRIMSLVCHAPAFHSPTFLWLHLLWKTAPLLLRLGISFRYNHLVGDVNAHNDAILRTFRAVVEARAVSRSIRCDGAEGSRRHSGLPRALWSNSEPLTVSQDALQDRAYFLVALDDVLVPLRSVTQFRDNFMPRAVLHVLEGANHLSCAEVGGHVHPKFCALVDASLHGARVWTSTYHRLSAGVPFGCSTSVEDVDQALPEFSLRRSRHTDERGPWLHYVWVLLCFAVSVMMVLGLIAWEREDGYVLPWACGFVASMTLIILRAVRESASGPHAQRTMHEIELPG